MKAENTVKAEKRFFFTWLLEFGGDFFSASFEEALFLDGTISLSSRVLPHAFDIGKHQRPHCFIFLPDVVIFRV